MQIKELKQISPLQCPFCVNRLNLSFPISPQYTYTHFYVYSLVHSDLSISIVQHDQLLSYTHFYINRQVFLPELASFTGTWRYNFNVQVSHLQNKVY